MKNFDHSRVWTLVLLLAFAYSTSYAQQTFGIFEVVDSRTSVTADVSVWNDNIFPPDIPADSDACNFTDVPMGVAFIGSPLAELSSYCFIRARASQSLTTCNRTRAWTASGIEAYETETGDMVVQFQVHSMNMHESEIFVNYNSTADSDAELYMDIEVPGPGPTQLVYYDFRGFISAISDSEGQGEDFAEVEIYEFSVAGIDMLATGSLPNFRSTNGPDGYQGMALNGYMYVPTDTSFTIAVRGRSEAYINSPGEGVFTWGCGSQWRDEGAATFVGTLTLSTVNLPLIIPPEEEPAFSYFSVDIGSASELSNPNPDSSEVFDPGDAYRIRGPLLPSGGDNGFFDDAFFMTFDFPPTPPDPTTAAPTESGLPPQMVIPDYLNIDAIARTDFDIALNEGGLVPIMPYTTSCVFQPNYLYVSFDDDPPGHYTSLSPSVPATATPDFTGRVFGSGSGFDEIVELYSFSPYLGGGYTYNPLARESDIHPNLAPNPSLMGPDERNDDVNALSMAYSADCNLWYFSVDHEATGALPDGTPLDPGTIYSAPVVAGEAPQPLAGPSELGIDPGTDVDAFTFVSLIPPPDLYPGIDPAYYLAVLFSVDWNDPLTPNTDESGGMMPNTIYASFMDGSHFVYDSLYLSGNIDALSNLLYSVSDPPQTNTCNSYNFTAAPQNFQVEITGNTLTATWDPYPFATACQLAGNRIDRPSDRTFIVSNTNPPGQNEFTFTGSQIQPGATYRLRVRCGCSSANLSPFTPYENVTAPPTLITGMPFLFEDEVEFNVYPNPADAFITVRADAGTEGDVQIRIFDAVGRLVRSETFGVAELISGKRIQTSDLTRGMYTLHAELPHGTQVVSFMITR